MYSPKYRLDQMRFTMYNSFKILDGSRFPTLEAYFLAKLARYRFTLRTSNGAYKALESLVRVKMERIENIIRLYRQNKKEWEAAEAAWMLSNKEDALQIIESVFGDRKAKRKVKRR
jgi:hypothetical protein